ncbi:MAG: FAD-dependent oxidoreductase [Chitinophagaceae bacterium]|nr:FAD-dependent oxidoreductase [Chitinophagaceae bacterium]
MAHDPLTGLLLRIFHSSIRENEESARLWQARQESRRRFLKESVLAAGGLLFSSFIGIGSSLPSPEGVQQASHRPPSIGPTPTSAGPSSTIAIVGAGMAGLHAAYCLKQKGFSSTIYEASARPGGRMFTMKDVFGPGLTTDVGGEFVDTTHTEILRLVHQLGLECYDLRADHLIPKSFWFEGQLKSQKELREAIAPFVHRIMQDIHALPPVISHRSADEFRRLDELSILEYLRSVGIGGWLFNFLNVVLSREYGMEASEQSAVNFLIMFEPPLKKDADYELFGQDHEVFKIKGGSQHLTDKLYAQVKDQVVFETPLTSLRPDTDGKGYVLEFADARGRRQEKADYVILTLPFTILRTLDLQIPLSPEKKKCIQEIGYGNSCKFIMGMKEKAWRHAGRQGYTFTDLSFGCGWDSTQFQSASLGSFTVFGGGDFGENMRRSKEEDLVQQYLPALDTIYKGASQNYTGRNLKFCWAGHPYSKAGYSSFKKGQWSTLAGWEGVPVGNVFFAGEHVSREFQGYMNGAAETGRVAAESVMARIHQPSSSLKQSTITYHE